MFCCPPPACLLFLPRRLSGGGNATNWPSVRRISDPPLEVLRLHLGRQRETVLRGGVPELESSWILRETEQGALILRPVDADPSGLTSPLRAESGRLDLRVTPKEWWGRVDELAPFSAALTKARQATSVRSLLQTEMSLEDFAQIEPLLTVHAEAPELQMDGRQRLPLGGDWNSEIAARVAERFGQVASDVLSDLSAKGQMPQDVGDLVRVLQSFDVPVPDWVEILDAFSFGSEVARGRVDLNTAPEAVLAAVPGIGPAAAEVVSSVRVSVSRSGPPLFGQCCVGFFPPKILTSVRCISPLDLFGGGLILSWGSWLMMKRILSPLPIGCVA